METLKDGLEPTPARMDSATESKNPLFKPARGWLFLTGLCLIVILRFVFLLPSILEFRNFAFRDLGSFQHVDRLIAQGLRPGVDFGFTYGLLGVLFQHMYFADFGAGHWQIFGMLIVYVLAMLAFWGLVARDLGQSPANFGVLLGLSGLMIYIAPFPPTPAHMLLQLALAFSLYFLLKRRLSLALLLAVLGSLAVPSMPIVLAGMLSLAIVWDWLQSPAHSLRALVSPFAPAAVGYAVAVAVMTAFFGWRTVLPSLLPMSGASHYRAMNFGFFRGGRDFWLPPHPHLTHYLFTPAGVWLLCSALLVLFGCAAALRMLRTRTLERLSLFVAVCCALHIVFIGVAFGNSVSYVYYSFFLVAGVLAGLCGLKNRRLRLVLSCVLLGFGILSQLSGINQGLHTWQSESASPDTASLYAPNDFQPEWRNVLSFTKNRRTLLLAYGTGVDFYQPEIGTPQSWMLLPGLLVPREDSYVLEQIRAADVVVVHLEGSSMYIDRNKQWQTALGDYPVRVSGRYFRIYARDPASRSELLKTAMFR